MSTQLNTQAIHALLDARIQSTQISVHRFTELSVEQGYLLQQQLMSQYIAQSQKKHTGWKVALSALTAQAKYALTQPVYGQLVADMHVNSPAKIMVSANEALKLEVELAFRLNTNLTANGAYSDAELIAAIADISPALEIVNVRWDNWNFNIGQFLADNAAAYIYVLGQPIQQPVQQILQNIQLETSSHEMVFTFCEHDNALKNYFWLVRTVLAKNISLNSGEILLTGSLIRPLNMTSGCYAVQLFGQRLAIQIDSSL